MSTVVTFLNLTTTAVYAFKLFNRLTYAEPSLTPFPCILSSLCHLSHHFLLYTCRVKADQSSETVALLHNLSSSRSHHSNSPSQRPMRIVPRSHRAIKTFVLTTSKSSRRSRSSSRCNNHPLPHCPHALLPASLVRRTFLLKPKNKSSKNNKNNTKKKQQVPTTSAGSPSLVLPKNRRLAATSVMKHPPPLPSAPLHPLRSRSRPPPAQRLPILQKLHCTPLPPVVVSTTRSYLSTRNISPAAVTLPTKRLVINPKRSSPALGLLHSWV